MKNTTRKNILFKNIVNEILDLTKDLQETTTIKGIFQLSNFFIIILTAATRSREIFNWTLNNIEAYKLIFILTLIIKPLTIIIITVVYSTKPSENTRKNGRRIKIYTFFRKILILNLKEQEYFLYPIKYLIFLNYF